MQAFQAVLLTLLVLIVAAGVFWTFVVKPVVTRNPTMIPSDELGESEASVQDEG